MEGEGIIEDMSDPRVLTVICLVFVALGIYNIYRGDKQIRSARQAGVAVRWYKQITLLTGIEYLLLSIVFLLSAASRQVALTPGLQTIVPLLYLLLLVSAGIIAVIVIYQGIKNARVQRPPVGSTSAAIQASQTTTSPSQEEDAQHRRERRKKAAAARRRRSGKA